MQRKQYELKINQACSKEWNSMTLNDGGRYCLHCEKTVVDFTNLSDNEIIQIIEQSSSKLCSRLNANQLNRVLESRHVSKNSQLYKLITGLIFLSSTGNSFATTKESETKPVSEIIVNIDEGETSQNIITDNSFDDSLKNDIIGTVFDSQTKEVLPFVRIHIKETNSKVLSDIDGNFTINLPDSFLLDSLTIVIKNVGYEEQEFIFERKDFLKPLKIFFTIPEVQFLGEVIYIEKKKKWWQFRK